MIDYRKDLVDFRKDIVFEGTKMCLYPAQYTSSGTKIWYVSVRGRNKGTHKFSMYVSRKNNNIEFRCCGIDDNVIGRKSFRIALVDKGEFLANQDVCYKVLSDLYEELA